MSDEIIKENLTKDQQIKYAWKWFEFHADQRLRAFYYYLLITGALSYGYLYCITTGRKEALSLAPWLAFLIAVISLVFLFIEIRNLDLVNIGRNELRRLQFKASIINYENYKKNFRNWVVSHRLWLRFIYLFILFIALDRSDFISKLWKNIFFADFPFPFHSPGKEIFLYLLLPVFITSFFGCEEKSHRVLISLGFIIFSIIIFIIWPFFM